MQNVKQKDDEMDQNTIQSLLWSLYEYESYFISGMKVFCISNY